MELQPYDSVLAETRDGNKVLAIVFGYEHPKDGIRAVPKYIPYNLAGLTFLGHTWKMLDEEWSRITYTPLVGRETKAYEILKKHYQEFLREIKGREEFVVPLDAIKDVFYSKEGAKKILREPYEEMNKVRKSAYKLLKSLEKEVGIDNLGVTGSLLFSGEIDDFSDIDITLYGSDTYHRVTNLLDNLRELPVHFRTKEEWIKYYEEGHYGFKVYSPFDKTIFAKHMVHKRDQFIFDGIEVTLFAVRNEKERKQLNEYKSVISEKNIGFITLKGRVLNNEESMFMFPSIYSFEVNRGRRITIENYVRACISQAQRGDVIEVGGLLKKVVNNNRQIEERILVTPENRGYIINLNWMI
jgi:predicted nucleotidyltransferase